MKKTIITFLLALVFPITASAQLESVKEGDHGVGSSDHFSN
jgi:hypothetical protein